MPAIIPNKFTKFQLTQNEEDQGRLFPPLNLMYLHNLRCMTAETLLMLEPSPTPEGYMSFIQQKAFLDAKLNLLNELINDDVLQPQPEGVN